MGAYQSAKWAVEGLSDVLSNEVKPFGVKVTIIEPGAPGYVSCSAPVPSNPPRVSLSPPDASAVPTYRA